jgi:hypothetical protein
MAPPHSCNFARPHTRVFVFVNERKPVDILRNPRIPNDFKLFSNSWKSKDFQGFPSVVCDFASNKNNVFADKTQS